MIWAITTRVDPMRDYLDFASPVSGLGSKMGMDAINKWPGETNRESADFQRLRRGLDASWRAP